MLLACTTPTQYGDITVADNYITWCSFSNTSNLISNWYWLCQYLIFKYWHGFRTNNTVLRQPSSAGRAERTSRCVFMGSSSPGLPMVRRRAGAELGGEPRAGASRPLRGARLPSGDSWLPTPKLWDWNLKKQTSGTHCTYSILQRSMGKAHSCVAVLSHGCHLMAWS